MKKIIKTILIILVLGILCGFYLHYENTTLCISEYEIKSNKIPKSFDGFKIAQISDFHNTDCDKLKNSLVQNLKDQKPGIIVITGDFIDSRRTDIDGAIKFIKRINNIAPVYYVSGNHEARINNYIDLQNGFWQNNVKVLYNQTEIIFKNREKINIVGIDDPTINKPKTDEEKTVKTAIEKASFDKQNFTVLLSHRPELFDIYAQEEIDLAFTGHAHGGQIRIPFLGGVIAPAQGFFPKYSSGVYQKDGSKMIVSRGIGNSFLPFRINNRPELIIATLKTKHA